MPPALAAQATTHILELLGEPPGRILELGFAGIHARPLELVGWKVDVLEPDPAHAARAREREAHVVERATGRYDAVVARAGAALDGIDAARIILVDEVGTASMAR
jgi:hypothetical protein